MSGPVGLERKVAFPRRPEAYPEGTDGEEAGPVRLPPTSIDEDVEEPIRWRERALESLNLAASHLP
ncbi:MAG: hypothetical protein R3199_11175 [Gemmatimonadota bacterium]|nr:hypothetical protein [Gemmatimonadota bacterium]